MSNKNILKELVPEAIDNATKNLTDQPTKNMGATLADIWYLVFGGISQAAEKRKLKYSYALQEFEKELKDKISKIPEDKLIEPDVQIVAKALDEAKYCVEKEDVRHMFSSLISASMNKDMSVSPIMVNIVSSLSPTNAKMLDYFYHHERFQIYMDGLRNHLNIANNDTEVYSSLIELHHLNLIYAPDEILTYTSYGYEKINGSSASIEGTRLTSLGKNLCQICLQ